VVRLILLLVRIKTRGDKKMVVLQYLRRAQPLSIDADIYKWGHLIENFFAKREEFKRIVMRADKTNQSFAALIYLAAAVINSR
jgi:transposase